MLALLWKNYYPVYSR